MDQRQKVLHRRDVVKVVPLAILGSAIAGLSRFITACTQSAEPAPDRENKPQTEPPSPSPPAQTDQNEFVPAGPNAPPPVVAGETPPSVPNAGWENRAKQLFADQLRIYGLAAFTATAPGPFVGKDKSHVPQVTTAVENGLKKVTVLVQHVMGSNGLPVPDAGPPVDAGVDAAKAPMDSGSDATADADAAPPPVVDAAPPATPPVHYITTMLVKALVNGADTVVGLWEFASTDPAPPSVKFTMPEGVSQIVAYEWCTLHGLWKTDTIPI
jgi:desulfoferrodoxin (superoxide reductase-like protein)